MSAAERSCPCQFTHWPWGVVNPDCPRCSADQIPTRRRSKPQREQGDRARFTDDKPRTKPGRIYAFDPPR